MIIMPLLAPHVCTLSDYLQSSLFNIALILQCVIEEVVNTKVLLLHNLNMFSVL